MDPSMMIYGLFGVAVLIVIAIIVVWAIGRGKDVSVSLNLPGANASLEVRDPGVERTVSPGDDAQNRVESKQRNVADVVRRDEEQQ